MRKLKEATHMIGQPLSKPSADIGSILELVLKRYMRVLDL